MDNRIDVVLLPETKEQVFQAVATALAALPFLIKLSDGERVALTIVKGRSHLAKLISYLIN